MIYLRASARKGPDSLWRGEVYRVWHGSRGYGNRQVILDRWTLGPPCNTREEAAGEADLWIAEYVPEGTEDKRIARPGCDGAALPSPCVQDNLAA